MITSIKAIGSLKANINGRELNPDQIIYSGNPGDTLPVVFKNVNEDVAVMKVKYDFSRSQATREKEYEIRASVLEAGENVKVLTGQVKVPKSSNTSEIKIFQAKDFDGFWGIDNQLVNWSLKEEHSSGYSYAIDNIDIVMSVFVLPK
jgi:hypothetical protein